MNTETGPKKLTPSERAARWNVDHPDRVKEIKARYRERHRAAAHAHYLEHRDEVIARSRAWAQANPERHLEHNRRSRARRKTLDLIS